MACPRVWKDDFTGDQGLVVHGDKDLLGASIVSPTYLLERSEQFHQAIRDGKAPHFYRKVSTSERGIDVASTASHYYRALQHPITARAVYQED